MSVETLRQFMQELAAAARSPGKVYFTGGATAFAQIAPGLLRYPAIDPEQFKNKLEDFLGKGHERGAA